MPLPNLWMQGIVLWSRDSVAGARGWTTEELCFDASRGQDIFMYFKKS